MQLTPFWTDDAPRPSDLTTTGLPATTGVLVVGAGVTGLSAARRLRAHDVDVTVVDAGPVGAGASTVNGGMATFGLKAPIDVVFDRYGPDLGRRFWDASMAAIDLVEHLVTSEGIDCAFSRSGAAELGMRRADLRHLTDYAAWLERHVGFRTGVLGRDRMHEVVGSDAFTAALVDPASAGLHPARYTYGLAAAAARAGARLVEHTTVEGVSRSGGGFVVATGRGPVSAEHVLIATNGYTGPLLPALRRKVVPIGSYIVVTEPLDRATAERLIPGNRMLFTNKRFLNYFRRTPDDRLLMGGRQDLSTDLDLTESAVFLRRSVERFFPDLTGIGITHSWNGRLGITFDLMPHIGTIDGVRYALGYGGHGLAMGTYCGAEAADLIAGESDGGPFAAIDHPGRWYYRGRPWFLPLAAPLYRMLDRFGR
jgi:glycine/D-amino acid oxidase-like deaminating enzyme